MRPNCEAGIELVCRLVVRCRLIAFGAAGASPLAALIGTTGGIRKIRGWRRGWGSAGETEFSLAAVTSVGVRCGLGLNKSSAFWRALSIFSRSV